MGLDAEVRCRCWEDGLVRTPPPAAEHVVLDDEDGLDLDLPWVDHPDVHAAFDDWLATACEHPGMIYEAAHIANWPGVRRFQAALRDEPEGGFPTLLRVIPDANQGLTSPADAAIALTELDAFARRPLMPKVALRDVASGRVLAVGIAAYGGVFLWQGPWRYGIDDGGFFLRHEPSPPESPSERFRSSAFTQTPVAEGFRFRDAASGAEVVAPAGVGAPDHPRELDVRLVEATGDFDRIVAALSSVLTAAIRIGNPVRWC